MTAADRPVAELLDELDAAREKVLAIRHDYPSLPTLVQKAADVDLAWSDGAGVLWVETEDSADAALIVAAVNALPRLTAALRAVLDLADELDRVDELFTVADRLRTTVAAALTPEDAR